MAKIIIDGVEYESDNLSEQATQQLQMLQLTEQEIKRLSIQLAIAQTARTTYANVLKKELPVSTAGLTIGEPLDA